jgi:hypothetical protein
VRQAVLYYPKIQGSENTPNGRCIAFEKLDGTNLHWDWDREFGWHSFGSRRDEFALSQRGMDLFKAAHAHLDGSAVLFLSTLADGLETIFRNAPHYQHFAGFRVFTEYLGPSSFAGLHKTEDPKQLVLFDVWADPFGFIGPKQFADYFGHLQIAKVVYEGRLTGKFAEDVRTGQYAVSEGVVCKGGKGGSDVWMAKIKTYAYMEKLKRAFAEKWQDYWE